MNIGWGLLRIGLVLTPILISSYVYGMWVNDASKRILIDDFLDWILYGGVKGNFVLVFLIVTGLGIVFKAIRWVILGFGK
tara:strand:+ start:80 stop:319 length:240 start_codon:yes stop_codon:yes gene_type:complete